MAGTGYVTGLALDDLTAYSFAAVGIGAGGQLVGRTGHYLLAPGLPVSLIRYPLAGPIGTTTTIVRTDSGGALVSGTTLVGIASHTDSVAVFGPTLYASAAASLDLIDAAGGPGSGFRPI